MKLRSQKTKPKSRPIVAVAWDRQELLAVVARRSTSGIRLLDTISLPIERGTTVSAAATKLAELLKERRVSSYQLLVGLPRSEVDMLSLQLPPANEAELPGLVRNEVLMQVPDLPDDTPIDFHLPADDRLSDVLRVEAAALRADTRETVNAVCESLKQPPAQIVIRSLAIASLFVRQINHLPDHSLLLNLLRSSVDLSVLSGRRITFTRSVHVTCDEQQQPDVGQLTDEIRRTLFVAPRQPTEPMTEANAVEHVYMFADLQRDSHFVEQLADELQLTVSLLDPLAGIELPEHGRPAQTHRFAALIGMIWDFVDGSTTLDLAHPRQPPPPPRYGRRLALYVAAALAALAIVTSVLKRDVDQAVDQAQTLAADVQRNKEVLQKIRSKTVVLDAVQRWEQSEINWLEELRRLSERFPPADKAVVQRVTMAPTTGSRGVISMSVRVQDPTIIARLEQDLRDESHQVSSQRISQTDAQQEFSTQFETSVVVK